MIKKLLYLLAILFLSYSSYAQTIVKVIPMEYWCGYLKSNGVITVMFSGSISNMPLPGGRLVKDATGCFNLMRAVATDGTVWQSNQYNVGPLAWTQISQDSTGGIINDAILISGFEDTYIITRADSSIWMGGSDYPHIFHSSGTVFMKPIKMTSNSLRFKKVVIGNLKALALTGDGDVWDWGNAAGISPTQRTFSGKKAIDIATGHYNVSMAVVQRTPGSLYGDVYVWGDAWGMWGSGVSQSFSIPFNLATQWGYTSLIKRISIDWQSTHYIDSLGSLKFAGGYEVQGESGRNIEFVNRYTYPTWPNYGWTFVDFQNQYIGQPVSIGPVGVKWLDIYDNNWFVFYKYAQDINGNFYFWGRNKTVVGGNGKYANNPQEGGQNANANHPNMWDVLKPTLVTPLITPQITYTFNYPVRNAGTDQNITTSIATVTESGHPLWLINGTDTAGYRDSTWLWTKVSGPTGDNIQDPTSKSTSILFSQSGTYRYRVLTMDNNQGMDTASLQIIVNISASTPPTVTMGPNQTIVLPQRSVSIYAIPVANGTATLTNVSWTQIGGPTVSNILSKYTCTTQVSNLSQGIYTYSFSATDDNGDTTTGTLTVTVQGIPTPTNKQMYFPISHIKINKL